MADGILIIDKAENWTSMDVCAKLRGILHEKRIGHAGTLDPMATGVLPVFVGRATRAVQFAESGRKEYVASLRLGLTTDTQDTTGNTIATAPVTVGAAELCAVLLRFTGEIEQIPPMYSAIKINGQKLYDLARRGVEVERKPRRITIYELELVEQTAPDTITLRVLCSKGTYIRSLCHDIGAALGCGGCMAALRRTMAADFTLADAVTLDEVQEKGESLLRPTDTLFRAHDAVTLTAQQERRARDGNPVKCGLADGTYRVFAPDGTFLSLSRAQDGTLTAIKNFFGA